MPPALRLPLGLAAGCAALLAFSLPAHGVAGPPEGPEALQALLARYDKEPAGAAKDKLAAQIDSTAHQKYATVSRLYWYTDFAAAQAAARASKKPILHLRMLGKLDEDLSCANSRLFRATLYANQEVSKLLRDRFILFWSSERPVPKVTIDYGDGRKIERTTTGNSAHYVLDADGNVLDILPGLYAAPAFRAELTKSLALAAKARGKSDEERTKLVVEFQRAIIKDAQSAMTKLAGTPYVPGTRVLLSQQRVETELMTAQRATVSKAAIEISDLRYITAEIAPSQWPEDQVAMWASAGQMLYGIGDLQREDTPRQGIFRRGSAEQLEAKNKKAVKITPPPRVLDDRSRALVVQLADAVDEVRTTADQRDTMVIRLEQHLVADSALNQLRLRPAIANHIINASGRDDFAKLNDWVYATVFRTPKEDAWLGLLPRTDFTGLPGDGVVMR